MGGVLGNWFFPNESRVPSDTVNDTSSEMLDFYKSGDQRVVRLNRRRGGVDGIYCCVVPDAVKVSSTILCIPYGRKIWREFNLADRSPIPFGGF